MRTIFTVTLLLLVCFHPAFGQEYTSEERAFIDEALATLKPYGPTYNEEQREIWQRLMELAAGHEDVDIIKAMFAAGERADGVMATQFDLDMFTLYKQNPAFFAKMVKEHYRGGIERFLAWSWINEIGEVSASDVVKHAGEPVTDPVLQEFIEKAVEIEKIPLDTE